MDNISSPLSGAFRGEPYIKQNVRNSKILDDMYIFDISDGCKFICERARHIHSLQGKTLFDIMSEDSIFELLMHFTSYTEDFIFVKTNVGNALAVPALVPSCSLGVLIFPRIGNDDFLRIAKCRDFGIRLSRELTDGKKWRLTKSSLANEHYCEELLDRVQCVFGNLVKTPHISGDITGILESRIYEIAHFIGCPVGIVCQAPICTSSNFDFGMFCAFVIVSMCIARARAAKNGAAVTLSEDECGVLVRFSILNGINLPYDIPAIINFRCAADRKRFRFEYTYSNEIIHLLLCPTAYDWSLLDIKSPESSQDPEPQGFSEE